MYVCIYDTIYAYTHTCICINMCVCGWVYQIVSFHILYPYYHDHKP